MQPPAIVDVGHRIEPVFHARHDLSDGSGPVVHRRVDRDHRRGFGDAIAFEDAQAEFFHVGLAGRSLDRLGASEAVAHRTEIVGMRGARIAAEERIGAEDDGRVGPVDQLRHDAVVQRRGVEIDGHAGDQRQHRTRRQAEGVKHRQDVEHLVACMEVDARGGLRGIGENIPVGEHHALRRTFRARSEQDNRRIVGLRATRGLLLRNSPRSLSLSPMPSRRSSSQTMFTALASSSTIGPSLACVTKAREVSIVRTSAALQADRMFAAPAVKLIIAGTFPADITPRMVAHVPLALGSMIPAYPDGNTVRNFSPRTAAPVSSLP